MLFNTKKMYFVSLLYQVRRAVSNQAKLELTRECSVVLTYLYFIKYTSSGTTNILSQCHDIEHLTVIENCLHTETPFTDPLVITTQICFSAHKLCVNYTMTYGLQFTACEVLFSALSDIGAGKI